MAGQLRVDEITDEAGTGSPSFPQGIQPNSLGTGTPGAGNFLRGDGVWEAVDIEGEIEAFAGGEPGQPRLVGNAVSLFPGTYPVLTVTASDARSVANGIATTGSNTSFNTTSFVNTVQHVIQKYNGTIRFRVGTLRVAGGSDPSNFQLEVLKNGVQVALISGTVAVIGVFTVSTVELSVEPTDTILWRARRTSGNMTLAVSNGNNTASNGYITATLFRPAV